MQAEQRDKAQVQLLSIINSDDNTPGLAEAFVKWFEDTLEDVVQHTDFQQDPTAYQYCAKWRLYLENEPAALRLCWNRSVLRTNKEVTGMFSDMCTQVYTVLATDVARRNMPAATLVSTLSNQLEKVRGEAL